MQSHSLGVKLLIVTLIKEIKPVVTESHHFQKRSEAILNKFPEALDNQHFEASINILGFQTNL